MIFAALFFIKDLGFKSVAAVVAPKSDAFTHAKGIDTLSRWLERAGADSFGA